MPNPLFAKSSTPLPQERLFHIIQNDAVAVLTNDANFQPNESLEELMMAGWYVQSVHPAPNASPPSAWVVLRSP